MKNHLKKLKFTIYNFCLTVVLVEWDDDGKEEEDNVIVEEIDCFPSLWESEE